MLLQLSLFFPFLTLHQAPPFPLRIPTPLTMAMDHSYRFFGYSLHLLSTFINLTTLALSGKNTMQYPDDVLWNCTLETYIIVLANVTQMNLIILKR